MPCEGMFVQVQDRRLATAPPNRHKSLRGDCTLHLVVILDGDRGTGRFPCLPECKTLSASSRTQIDNSLPDLLTDISAANSPDLVRCMNVSVGSTSKVRLLSLHKFKVTRSPPTNGSL